MAKTDEKAFEEAIEEHLLHHGYERVERSDWDPALAFCPGTVLRFVRETQPAEWARLQETYGTGVEGAVVREVAKQLDRYGLLQVLRHGIRDRGIHYRLCFFKPATTLNPETVRLYGLNRLGILRQEEFDAESKKTIDVVLFVNGLPVATVELKNAFTGQRTAHAIRQYLRDRKPSPKTPLLQFKKRALVHFAVDADEAWMTTRLAGEKTAFLPFNRGFDGGKGNPPNPGAHRTSYLWEAVWERENWLDILHRFVQREQKEWLDPKTGRRETAEALIFPRYHQWDAVKKLREATAAEGPGQRYLVQHSAGSGKTNTIGWTAHQLASLHDAVNRPVFDAVIVVSDRRNLDKHLQDNIFQVEHKQGVVELIQPREGRSKSSLLAAALNRGTRIIVTTLQTFSHVLEKDLEDLSKRRFAVIADEAHSSQTGKSAANLRVALGSAAGEDEALRAAEEADAALPREPDPDEEILRWIQARGPQKNLSFYAFTATPKKKTVELFGRPGPDGIPRAFHPYPMRQAIEEGFILDVLLNYTTYTSYFQLTKRIVEDPRHEKDKSRQAIARFLKFHGHVLDQKSEVMLRHFRQHVEPRIGGQAKAMVVTSSRLHAVRYKQAFDRYLGKREREDPGQGWGDLRALVAFSGTVVDPHDEAIQYTESRMNGFPESETEARFDTGEYRLLIVAEKYQTGFDQPKLHTLYVDKSLKDLQAVQTLSRLNRAFPGKVDTFVLDFVNDVQDIREAFKPYYEGAAEIDEPTDPNLLYKYYTTALGYGVIWEADVEDFARVFFKPKAQQKKSDHGALNRAVDPAVVRYAEVFTPEHRDKAPGFKKLLRSFVRLYGFIAQLYDLGDVSLEKYYAYVQALLPKLPRDDGAEGVDLSGEIRLESYRQEKTFEGDASLKKGDKEVLTGFLDAGEASLAREPELLPLSEILKEFNERYGTNWTRSDFLCADQAMQDLQQNHRLVEQARHNSRSNFRPVFAEALVDALFQRRDRNQGFFDELMANDAAMGALTELMLDRFRQAAVSPELFAG